MLVFKKGITARFIANSPLLIVEMAFFKTKTFRKRQKNYFQGFFSWL